MLWVISGHTFGSLKLPFQLRRNDIKIKSEKAYPIIPQKDIVEE